jgi:hypothetical protein
MAEIPAGCARPSGTVVGEKPDESRAVQPDAGGREVTMTARVGQKAPDFTAPAYYKGKFVSVHLADFLGKWVMLCFYPGDFTFV